MPQLCRAAGLSQKIAWLRVMPQALLEAYPYLRGKGPENQCDSAVVAMRFDRTEIASSSAQVAAYGNAGLIEPVSRCNNRRLSTDTYGVGILRDRHETCAESCSSLL
jgi:hypothetical protein